ncbi:MAG: SoxR reducing system RseC family protein [Candidatus Aminicenantes bacterium]
MKDNGKVLRTGEGFADVEVQCMVESCKNCSAKNMCRGSPQSTGQLKVKNPVHACVGDEVIIEIPERDYNKMLIFVFGILLTASLLGMSAGYLASLIISFSSQNLSIAGLFLGIALAGLGFFFYFRRQKKDFLYPVITEIIKKGDQYG